MTLTEIRRAYPRTYRLLTRLLDQGGIHRRAAEGLSCHALARIESGQTSERDVRVLLLAHGSTVHRR